MVHDVGQRRHGADLDAAVALADALQLRDAAKIHHVTGALNAILQPVEAVETAGEDPCVGAIAIEQVQRIPRGRRLKQLEGGHYISDYSHGYLQVRLKADPTGGVRLQPDLTHAPAMAHASASCFRATSR